MSLRSAIVRIAAFLALVAFLTSASGIAVATP